MDNPVRSDARIKDFIIVLDPETMTIVNTFDYASEAARLLKVSRQDVHSALNRGHRCKGYFLYRKSVYESMFSKG